MNNYMIGWDFSKHDSSDVLTVFKELPNGKYMVKKQFIGEDAHLFHKILSARGMSIQDIIVAELVANNDVETLQKLLYGMLGKIPIDNTGHIYEEVFGDRKD